MSETQIVDLTAGEVPPERLILRLRETISAGSLLRIRGGDLKTAMALRVLRIRTGRRELPIVHRYTSDEQLSNWSFYTKTYSMAVAKVDVDLPVGASLELQIEGGPGLVAGITWSVSAGITDDVHSLAFECVTDEAGVRFLPGTAEYVEAYLKPGGLVCVQQFDALGNPAVSDESALRVSAGRCSLEARAPGGLAATRIELPARAAEALRAVVTDAAGRSAQTNARPVAIDGSNIYFGDPHWHCRISCDGQRDLAAALTSARDEMSLDFAGPSDHMDCDGRYYTPLTRQHQADVCRSFDEPGVFCTIPGAELGGRGGHVNFYCDSFETFLEVTDRFEAELKPHFATELFNLQALSSLCPAGKAVIVPHHTNANSGGVVGADGRPLWNAMHFPLPPDRKAVRLIEVVQSSGAYESEQADERWRIRRAGLGGSARTALTRGYRLGFIAGTDNHAGWPGRGGGKERVGLTAVIAGQLDTASIFEAFCARRCYATSGARIVADATCNGRPAGSELGLGAGERPELRIRIHGTCPLTDVQIVHMGYVLADLPVEKECLDFEATWADDRPGRPLDDAYYYVRGRQEDGHCVWLSGFWIDLKA
ncbi:MAG: CehA/McbA family metallohydrolase domain-containing protein [Planctomycetota bacterium]|jgi:hypothetical protein